MGASAEALAQQNLGEPRTALIRAGTSEKRVWNYKWERITLKGYLSVLKNRSKKVTEVRTDFEDFEGQ